ncbi:MAG TPA: 4-hydroxy-3-methylbut-2-enyl diphosphate reductase [Streptosporangiaceae bacterium]
MSRPVARECLAPGITVAPGEVMVATAIGDPARGLLPCPAAPLVGGVPARRGIPVRYGPVPQYAEASQADDGAVLFVTSALLGDGEATAIGAAANAVDGVSAAAARSAVEEWSAVVGSRRLLGAVSPWCDGATHALALAREALWRAEGPVHVYGPLAASERTLAELTAAGAVFVTSLVEVPDGATLVLPAHGVPQVVHEEAERLGLRIVDATCPLVAALHAEIRRFADRGDQVAIIGPVTHAVAAGLAGQAPDRAICVESPAGARAVRVADPRRVSYVLQPGIPVEDAGPVSAALRSRFPAVRGPDPDLFCYAASDREGTIRTIAAASDVVLVLGDEDEPDTRRVTGLARACHAKAHVIGGAGQILPSWLAGAGAIGLAETLSARPGLADEVTAALSGLGPLSVTRRRVTTEILGTHPQPGIS